jgi:hypothetical protein
VQPAEASESLRANRRVYLGLLALFYKTPIQEHRIFGYVRTTVGSGYVSLPTPFGDCLGIMGWLGVKAGVA